MSACAACAGTKSGPQDLLCHACWRRLPTRVVELYRLIWRLAQAQLVEAQTRREFERLLVDEATRLAPAPAVTRDPAHPAAPARRPAVARPVPARANTRGAVSAALLAALPTNPKKAITPRELAERAGREVNSVQVWCTEQRRAAHPEVRWIELTPPGAKRLRCRYWREVAA